MGPISWNAWQVGNWCKILEPNKWRLSPPCIYFTKQPPCVHSLRGKKKVGKCHFFPVSASCLEEGVTQLYKQPLGDAIIHTEDPREPFAETSPAFSWEMLPVLVSETAITSDRAIRCCTDLMTGAQSTAYLHFIFLLLNSQVIIKHSMSTGQQEELIKGSLLM